VSTTYRDLHPFPLEQVMRVLAGATETRLRIMTMSSGQWDALLAAAYEDGWVLLEVDEHETPVKAYQKIGAREEHS
jgi:hypothetical protein